MSDDEHMDDYVVDQSDYDIEYSSDDASDGDYQFENIYYEAKSIKDGDWKAAIEKFMEVVKIERDGEKSEWGFKCHKQICKILFANKVYDTFFETLEGLMKYIDTTAITKNYSEKSLNSILEYVSISSNAAPADVQSKAFNMCLKLLEHSPNERLWFKTQLKLGKMYLGQKKWSEVSTVCHQLNSWCEDLVDIKSITASNRESTRSTELTPNNVDRKMSITSIQGSHLSANASSANSTRGAQFLEVYALEIQMCTEQRNYKRLKELYSRALSVKSAMVSVLDQGIIRECGGKMHLREMAYDSALTDFFEAFKCFDECGSKRSIQCLKYVVLASMLSKSNINPFDSQEAKPYKNTPVIATMTQLVQVYQEKDSIKFEKVLKENIDSLKNDPFIWEYIEKLCKNIHIESIVAICQTSNTVTISELCTKMCVSSDEATQSVIHTLLEKRVCGKFDQVTGVLYVENVPSQKSVTTLDGIKEQANQENDDQNNEQTSPAQVGANLSEMIARWTVQQAEIQQRVIQEIVGS